MDLRRSGDSVSDVPSTTDTGPKSGSVDAVRLCKRRGANAVVAKGPALICVLLGGRGPPTIAGLVVAVDVVTLERQALSVAVDHSPSAEGCVASVPLDAHTDAASAVILEAGARRVRAALPHPGPDR